MEAKRKCSLNIVEAGKKVSLIVTVDDYLMIEKITRLLKAGLEMTDDVKVDDAKLKDCIYKDREHVEKALLSINGRMHTQGAAYYPFRVLAEAGLYAFDQYTLFIKDYGHILDCAPTRQAMFREGACFSNSTPILAQKCPACMSLKKHNAVINLISDFIELLKTDFPDYE